MGFLFLPVHFLTWLVKFTQGGVRARGCSEFLPGFSVVAAGCWSKGTVSSVQVYKRGVLDSVGRGTFGSTCRYTAVSTT